MANQIELGEHLGLSRSSVAELVRTKVIPKPKGRAAYDLDDCRLRYCEYMRDALADAKRELKKSKATGKASAGPRLVAGTDVDLDDADEAATGAPSIQERLQLVKLAAAEREEALKAGEVAPIALLEDWARNAANLIRSGLENLDGQIKTRIPHLNSAQLGIIKTEAVRVSDRIADFQAADNAATA